MGLEPTGLLRLTAFPMRLLSHSVNPPGTTIIYHKFDFFARPFNKKVDIFFVFIWKHNILRLKRLCQIYQRGTLPFFAEQYYNNNIKYEKEKWLWKKY